jgi:hypothetical protein
MLFLDFLLTSFKSFFDKTYSFIKYSTNFILKTHNIRLDDQDLMVSVDVVSLFTKILVSQSLTQISKLLEHETLNVIKIFLSSLFTFKGVLYEETEGTTMDSSISPIVANIFMEHFEILAIIFFYLKPKF